ncbi:MAG: hypothetical protein IPP72_02530 [Chitinophagaceae bacterium]|nr:hypothetical protein [Chitinophagaceae bacterium]
MSINLLETVQKKLGYPALQKIDPNTLAVAENAATPDEHRFSQAAISATLTALYKYVQSDEGAAVVLRGGNSTDWVSEIFHGNQRQVLQTIASYSKQPKEVINLKLNEIAGEAIKITKENLPSNAGIIEVKSFFSTQINTILLYLPAGLNMGTLLNDDGLDDNTNKMEGPVSGLMRSIGAAFSTPVTEAEIKN